MAKFTKTNNKVSFFKIAQSKYNELLNATADSGNGIIAGAIYFVEDGKYMWYIYIKIRYEVNKIGYFV